MSASTCSRIANETLLSLPDAAKRLPSFRRGRPVTTKCVLSWVVEGIRTPQGMIRLEAIRMGGRWLTSVQALERFAVAQTPRLGESVNF